MRHLLIISVFILTLLPESFLHGCTDKSAAYVTDPPALNEQEKAGERIFMQNCQRCHPQGDAGLGPSIHWSPAFAKRFQIRHGLGAMPSFDKEHLPEKEMDQLIAYLKALD